jgi:hypothetical protein
MASLSKPSRVLSRSEMDAGGVVDPVEQQFALLTVDYEQTLGIANGLVASQGTTRGIAATAYLAFLGLGIDHRSWALCAASSLIAIAFFLQNARQDWIYHQLLQRANQIERLFQRRLQALDLPYDPYPAKRLRAELDDYDFGVLGHISRFHIFALRAAVKRWALAAYCLPAVLGIVAAALV